MKQESPESPTKSCLNCVHCHQWSTTPTLEQPGEDGWECKHPKVFQADLEDPEDIGDCCPFFESIDYQALAEFEKRMDALIDKAFDELRTSQPY